MNAVGLVVFALWTGVILAASAWLLERALTSLRLPVRWVWMGALAISVWLPLAALVSGPPERGTVGVTGPAEAVVPADRGGLAEGAGGDGGQGTGVALDLLFGWWAESGQILASGADLLPTTEVSPLLIAGLWGGASMLVALVLGASLLRLRGRARRWPDEMVLGRAVKISPDTGPATVGLLTPEIVIPRWARCLDEPELELILRHEGEHVLSRDTLLLALGLAAVIACPWSPLVWWKMRRLKAAVEVDCDRRVLRDGTTPAHYGTLLVTLGTRGRFRSLAVPTIAGSVSLLERRLTLMKNLHRRASVPPALATTAVALLLVGIACTSEPPMPTTADAASEPSPAASAGAASEPPGEEVVAAIWTDRDGTVQVNGAAYPVDRVSEAVAPLYAEGAVVSIQAHQAAPYRVVSAVQDEIRAAGLLRVVFTAVESGARRSPTRDVSTLLDEGLAMVLPETGIPNISQVNVDPRNLLFLDVLPTGAVATRRGASPLVQRITPAQVEGVMRQGLVANPSLIAVLRTHPDAEYRHMYEVLGAIQRANATRFSLQLAE